MAMRKNIIRKSIKDYEDLKKSMSKNRLILLPVFSKRSISLLNVHW
jgi:hypothetical protein